MVDPVNRCQSPISTRWLLNDTTLNTADGVAGLLVLLYAQWPATISRLTLDHVDADDQAVRLRLGPQPVVLPEPLATLVRELLATRHGHATIGAPTTCQWLFPGGQPGQPISAYQLAQRLRQLGLHPGKSRSTALFQLATDLPAAILSRMLGIHITVAVLATRLQRRLDQLRSRHRPTNPHPHQARMMGCRHTHSDSCNIRRRESRSH